MGAIGFHRRAKALVLDGLYGVYLLPDDSGRNPGGHVAFGPTGI